MTRPKDIVRIPGGDFPLETVFWRMPDGSIDIRTGHEACQYSIVIHLNTEQATQLTEALLTERGKITGVQLKAIAGADQLREFLRENRYILKAYATADATDHQQKIIRSMAALILLELAEQG